MKKPKDIWSVDTKGTDIILKYGAWTIYAGIKNKSKKPAWNDIVIEWKHESKRSDLSKFAAPFTPDRSDFNKVKMRAFKIIETNWKKAELRKLQPMLPGLE